MRKILLFYIVFAICVSLLWTALSSSSTPYDETWLSLDYFLNYMSRVPIVNLQDLTLTVYSFNQEWLGIIDWVRQLLNLFGYALGISRWIGVAIYNLVVIVLYFVRFFVDSTFGIQTILPGPELGPSGGTTGAGGGFGGGGGGGW